MRKIAAGFAISLDGYIEGPNGEYDWIIMEKDFDFAAHAKRFDSYLFGRKSYEQFIKGGGSSAAGIKHYVFSGSLDSVAPGFILVKEKIEPFITNLKKEDGKDIAVYGGAELLTSLLDLNLVDEITMSVMPVLLGQGKPAINILKKRISLQLTDIKKFSGGTVHLSYLLK